MILKGKSSYLFIKLLKSAITILSSSVPINGMDPMLILLDLSKAKASSPPFEPKYIKFGKNS